MKQIELTQGKFALVDDEDYEYLNQFKWHYNNGYACRWDFSTKVRIKILMHREIMRTTNPKILVDHRFHDTLDNRKEMLRTCSDKENNCNLQKRPSMYSSFKGVTFHKNRNKWQSAINFNKKYIYLGSFKTEIEAAKAYNEKAKELHGEFALLNVI